MVTLRKISPALNQDYTEKFTIEKFRLIFGIETKRIYSPTLTDLICGGSCKLNARSNIKKWHKKSVLLPHPPISLSDRGLWPRGRPSNM